MDECKETPYKSPFFELITIFCKFGLQGYVQGLRHVGVFLKVIGKEWYGVGYGSWRIEALSHHSLGLCDPAVRRDILFGGKFLINGN